MDGRLIHRLESWDSVSQESDLAVINCCTARAVQYLDSFYLPNCHQSDLRSSAR